MYIPRNIEDLIEKSSLPDDNVYDRLARHLALELHSELKFNDPLANKSWQFLNSGDDLISTTPGLDLNVYKVYEAGFTGKNVNVIVLDDALDYKHDDISKNYAPNLSIDLINPERSNPRGTDGVMSSTSGHGTSVAALAAGVANNSKCSFGAAYNANIGGIRVVGNDSYTALLVEAFLTFVKEAQIYITSWGPTDNGQDVFDMEPKLYEALHYAVTLGNSKRGVSIFTSAGNGGYNLDNCGADSYINSPFVLSINAIGEVGMLASYSEMCSAILTSVPVAGDYDDAVYKIRKRLNIYSMPTSDANNGCRNPFLGTSASAPLAAGCGALAIEANPELTWRDIQALLIFSSRIPHPTAPYWYVNGAGVLMSNAFGAGLLNCAQLVSLAMNWRNIGPLCVKKITMGKRITKIDHIEYSDFQDNSRLLIRKASKVEHSYVIGDSSGGRDYLLDSRQNGCKLEVIEVVHITAQWFLHRRGATRVSLESPSGLKVILLDWRPKDDGHGLDETSWKSVMHFGESISGKWTITFEDEGTNHSQFHGDIIGVVNHLKIMFFGTRKLESAKVRNRDILSPLFNKISTDAEERNEAHKLSTHEIRQVYDSQRWLALFDTVSKKKE